MLTGGNLVIAAGAAMAAGAVNALAGGGTLITFPALLAIGIPPVAANVTNAVALCPGYLGGTLAQRNDLRPQKERLRLLIPAGLLGGIAGALLLLETGERMFQAMVPFLILLASLLLGLQDPIRRLVQAGAGRSGRRPRGILMGNQPATSPETEQGVPTRSGTFRRHPTPLWSLLPIAAAAVYGGYFGAGLSVILLAVLALALDESLTRLNAMKQAVALAANVGAAVVFAFSGEVVWSAAVVMALAALGGGMVGGRLAGRVRAAALRWIVVGLGIVVAAVYLSR